MILYHASPFIVEKPLFIWEVKSNDSGPDFAPDEIFPRD